MTPGMVPSPQMGLLSTLSNWATIYCIWYELKGWWLTGWISRTFSESSYNWQKPQEWQGDPSRPSQTTLSQGTRVTVSTVWPVWKTYSSTDGHDFACWISFTLDTESRVSGSEEEPCHSPAQVAHRPSGTWPVDTVLWRARIWASDLTAGYSCWILPSSVEISFNRKRKQLLMWEVTSVTFPATCLFSFFSLLHDSTFFKQ